MFTAMAALTVWTVGPHRTFDTRAHVVRDDSKGAVLCVHPSGDPTLRPADVDDLARASLASSDVPASEVRRVRLGGKEWQDEGAHPTWEVGDTRRAWAAPPSRATMTSDEAGGPRPPRDAAAPPNSPRRRLLHRLEATLELTPADPDLPPRHCTVVRVVRDGRLLTDRVAQLPARLGVGSRGVGRQRQPRRRATAPRRVRWQRFRTFPHLVERRASAQAMPAHEYDRGRRVANPETDTVRGRVGFIAA